MIHGPKGKVGLIDIDSKIPNLALMKAKSFYGDNAKMITPIESFSYDVIYASKVFNYSYLPLLPDKAFIGGTGYNLKVRMFPGIEQCQPDYSIYPMSEMSLQRYSTGCINRCPFCVVGEKEGDLAPCDPVNLNPKGTWIYLLDNNFFASPNWLESIKHLIACKQPVQFEGVDVRILNDEHLYWLSKVKLKKQIHLAWDNAKEDLRNNFKTLSTKINPRKLMVYVLVGFNSSEEEDLYRVEYLRSIKIDPFVMPYNKEDKYQRRFARWVNHKAIFKTVKWEEYK